jgi:exodeoxyribonuclease VII large subunit
MSLFGKEILTPSIVAERIQLNFDNHIKTIWVEGEINSLARPASGHLYFQLKDAKAVLKAVIWRGRLIQSGGKVAQDGLKVLARGSLAVYPPRGEYQMMVDHLEPLGEGALRLAFEKLKKRLADEGLFDEARKRPLPFFPKKIALLSSLGSAAAKDFITTAVKRHKGIHISLYPVRVQGAGAALEMVQALADINDWGGFDLIVLSRGGGSLEDLWAFNEEVLVKAVASSRTTTLAAIGHSTDLSLVEMAADLKAITPTEAAEKAVPSDERLLEGLAAIPKNLYAAANSIFKAQANKLLLLWRRLLRFESRLLAAAQTLDNLTSRLHQAALQRTSTAGAHLAALTKELELKSPIRELHSRRTKLNFISHNLLVEGRRKMERKKTRLESATERLKLVSPLGILERGYAVVTNSEGRLIRASDQLSIGEVFKVRLAKGELTAKVSDAQ